jgi:septal ring factor EnvC (AmiA/AmiB activator)
MDTPGFVRGIHSANLRVDSVPMNILQKAALAVRAALSGPARPMAPRARDESLLVRQRELALRRKELAEARARLTEELARLDAQADQSLKAGNDAAARERLRQARQTREALASNASTLETLARTEQEIKAQMAAVARGAEKTREALERAQTSKGPEPVPKRVEGVEKPAAQTNAPLSDAPLPPPIEDEASLRARMDRLRGSG